MREQVIKLGAIDLKQSVGSREVLSFLLSGKELKTNKNGGLYADLTVQDRDVKCSMKIWSMGESELESYQVGGVYKAIVDIKSFNDLPSLIGNALQLTDASPSEYAHVLDGRELYINRLNKHIEGLTDKVYRDIVLKAFKSIDFSLFVNGIGGLRHHHTEIGGLLRHTVEVANITSNLCAEYSKGYDGYLDKDLAIVGALVHDIGKIYEYKVDLDSYTAEYNTSALSTHLIDGSGLIDTVGTSLIAEVNGNSDLADETKAEMKAEIEKKITLIKSIITSHHKMREWGALTDITLLEGELVFIADYTSSRFDGKYQVLSNLDVGGFDRQTSTYRHI